MTITDIDPRVVALLDVSLALSDDTYRHSALLPGADRFAIVDTTIRFWARSHDCRIKEWGHWNGSQWLEGCRVYRGDVEIVTLHTPEACQTRRPVDDGCGPCTAAEMDQMWRPSDSEMSP